MKTLVDEITGRKDFPIFNGSDENICKWINLNLDSMKALNEPHSCEAQLIDGILLISGDEDLRELRIIEVDFIEVD